MNTKKIDNNTFLSYSIIITLIIFIPLLLLLFINPINKKIITLSQENENLKKELINVRSNFKNSIEEENRRSKHINEKLKMNWQKIKATISQLNTVASEDSIRPIDEDAIIDYKISLFNTDIMLREEAASHNMMLPKSIGLPEDVEESQSIEVLFNQLSVISKLIRLAIKSGVMEISSIKCYPPQEHLLIEQESAVVTEFPIKINIVVSYKELLNLLINFNNEGTFIAISEIEILKADRFNKDILYVDLTCASFGFTERYPEDGYINNDTVIDYLKELEKGHNISPSRRGRTRGGE